MKNALLILALLLLPGARAAAQAQWFPATHPHTGPLADPLEPRFAGSLLVTDLLSRRGPERPLFVLEPFHDATREVQAAVTFGRTIPLLAWQLDNGVTVAITGQASVNGRFRIELSSRDDMGQDWMAALPVEIGWNAVTARFRLLHRSSHLGDEFSQSTGAQRIEYGGDGFDLALAYRISALRLHASGQWIFHSNTEEEPLLFPLGVRDVYVVQFGADVITAAARPLGLVAGVHAELAERTEWRTSLSAIAGVSARVASRKGRLVLRYHTGVSPMGEFFLTQENYFGLELVLDW